MFLEELELYQLKLIKKQRKILIITTGLEEYKIALYNVKAAIQDKDPKNRDLYEDNYNKLIELLDKTIDEVKINQKGSRRI